MKTAGEGAGARPARGGRHAWEPGVRPGDHGKRLRTLAWKETGSVWSLRKLTQAAGHRQESKGEFCSRQAGDGGVRTGSGCRAGRAEQDSFKGRITKTGRRTGAWRGWRVTSAFSSSAHRQDQAPDYLPSLGDTEA